MRLLKKINKGLVLTIIVIVTLVVYLVGVEAKRSAEKPHIEQAVKDYIELVDKFAVMPEEYQKIHTEIKNEDEANRIDEEFEKAIQEQLTKFEDELKTKMVDNKTARDQQKIILEVIISSSNNPTQNLVIKYDREIKKIKKYKFDEDQVTVTFDSNIQIETKYIENDEERTKMSTQKIEDEAITLKLENGTWKIVYADLRFQPNMSTSMFGIF